MKKQDAESFEKLAAQLRSVHTELSLLSRKSPNDAVNKFKIKFVNKIIGECNDVLGSDNKPFDDFSEFSEDEMPSNSDVTLIISQYMESMELARVSNIHFRNGSWYWTIDGEKNEQSTMRTSMPLKLKK